MNTTKELTTENRPKIKLNKKQILFMDLYINPESESFGNAYRSGIKCGFSPSYSKNITNLYPKWLSEYMDTTNFRPEHVKQAIQDIYSNPETYRDAKSPADTRLKALELYARVTGMLNTAQTTNVTLVQPILSSQSVKKVDNTIIEGK